jgi:uroporphyrinogen-III synthase
VPKAPPILLLTRPIAQSERFLRDCEDALGRKISALISPVIGIELRPLTVDPGRFAGVIFTSENAVTALGRPDWSPGVTAWCVGRRTADAAAAAGFTALSADGDARALLARILGERPEGPLLHLAGAHLAADIAAELTQSGVPAETVVVYDQVAVPLNAEARALLSNSQGRVVLPLFSPRSARLVRAGVEGVAAGVVPLAMSDKVADAWGTAPPVTKVAMEPTAAAMRALVLAEMRDDSPC